MVTQEQWQEAYLRDCLQRHREAKEVSAMKKGKGSKGGKGGKGKPC